MGRTSILAQILGGRAKRPRRTVILATGLAACLVGLAVLGGALARGGPAGLGPSVAGWPRLVSYLLLAFLLLLAVAAVGIAWLLVRWALDHLALRARQGGGTPRVHEEAPVPAWAYATLAALAAALAAPIIWVLLHRSRAPAFSLELGAGEGGGGSPLGPLTVANAALSRTVLTILSFALMATTAAALFALVALFRSSLRELPSSLAAKTERRPSAPPRPAARPPALSRHPPPWRCSEPRPGVFECYQAFLRAVSAAGLKPGRSMTPREVRRALVDRLPVLAEAASGLTGLYEETRYGLRLATEQDLAAARRWYQETVRGLGGQPGGEGR